jgi:hypothetical protein
MNFDAWKNMKSVYSARIYTREQVMEIITPVICKVCRRLFNPTDEEREKDRLALEEIDKSMFEWEVNMNYEAN